MSFNSLKKSLSFISIIALIFGQTLAPTLILAQEATSSAEATSPRPVWQMVDGVATTASPVVLGQTYRAPQNDKVTITFNKLPEGSGIIIVKEHEVPSTVNNAGSKDYEITSNMPNGSFSFDLTLPTNDPDKEVLSSNDGQNYDPVSNETTTSSDTITIKGITHLTHFIVADESAGFNHPVINEFLSDGSNEWVEIYNPTNQEQNITDWSIEDNDPDTGSPFTFPEGSTIPAKGFLVADADSGFNVTLNDTGDTVNLITDSAETLDSHTYSADPGSATIGRGLDGGPDWTIFSTPTPGASNGTTLDTLYVDDDWNSPDNDGGYSWGFNAFKNISDAIDYAPSGSTINVEPGSYNEELTIDKSLILQGPAISEGENLATVNSTSCDYTISISASNVTVNGFDLTNECGETNVYINPGLQDVNISENVIRDGNAGVYIAASLDNPTENTLIENNQITNNYYGVYLQGDVSGTRITNNSINQASGGDGGGIFSDSDDLTFSSLEIINNIEITDSGGYGIYFSWFSGTLTVSGNDLSNNYYEGIYLYAENSTVNISQNAIESNGTDEGYSGLSINQVINSNVTIQNNSAISSNGQYGIHLGNVDDDSGVTISGNTIQSNSSTGIYLNSGVTNTVISGNTISSNGVESDTTGIVVQSALGNEAHENIIQNNGSVGVENGDSENFFNAGNNFWGDASGPLDTDLNPNGLGNATIGLVLFSPFYTDSILSTLTEVEFNASTVNIANFDDWGIFDLPSDEEGQDFVRYLDLLQQLELEAAEEGGENDIVLPEGVRIERSDDLEFDWDSLSFQDVSESLMSGFDGTTSIVDAVQWGLAGVELEFSTPITVRIFVGTSYNGQTLNIVRSTSGSGGWTSSGIVAPGTCTVADGICSFQATKASYYATTQTTPSSTTSASSTSSGQALSPAGGGGTPPSCNDQKPGSAPTLISAVAGKNSVALTWNKALNPVTYYLATYGLSAGAQQYGNPNIGGPDTTSYTVEGLSGGTTTYYFRVRAGHGCAPGDFSNELSATPGGGFVVGPAAGFAPGVLGITTETDNVGLGEEGQIQGEATESTNVSLTTQPQQSAQSPFNTKVILVIIVAFLLGFGVFKLIIK